MVGACEVITPLCGQRRHDEAHAATWCGAHASGAVTTVRHVERVRSLRSNRMVDTALERRRFQTRPCQNALDLSQRLSVSTRLRTRRRGRPCRRPCHRRNPRRSLRSSQEPQTRRRSSSEAPAPTKLTMRSSRGSTPLNGERAAQGPPFNSQPDAVTMGSSLGAAAQQRRRYVPAAEATIMRTDAARHAPGRRTAGQLSWPPSSPRPPQQVRSVDLRGGDPLWVHCP